MAKVKDTEYTTESTVVTKAAPTPADMSTAAASGPTSELKTAFFQTSGNAIGERALPQTLSIGGEIFLEPPENPVQMYKTYQLSAYWEAIIEALSTNVYRAGFTLQPIIPFDRADEAFTMVKEAMLWEASDGDFDSDATVIDEEVDAKLEQLKRRSIIEKQFLIRFFQEVVPDMSYRRLWEMTGQDEEITGNGYWEIIRDTEGKLARWQWLQSISIRATKQDTEQIVTEKLVRDSAISWKKTTQIRRFRRYAQVYDQRVVTWFKEYGDPRVLSRTTGKFYKDVLGSDGEVLVSALQQMQSEETQNKQLGLPATEIYHWRIPFGGSSVYGKTRASGIMPGLTGSRDLDEENLKIVADEAIPSLLMMISGGTVGSKSYDRMKSDIENRKPGRKGIMLIEAISGAQVGVAQPQQQPKISIERMKSEQNGDALFQNYDKRNEEKAGGAYRMPNAALGKQIGANRATVAAMNRYTEDQVYGPKRTDRDEPINGTFFAELDILLWRYESKSHQPSDPQLVSEILRTLVEAGVLTPNEAREKAGPIFNERFDDLKGLWTMFPPRIMTVLLQTKNAALAAAMLGEDPDALEQLSKGIRGALGIGADGTTQQNGDGEAVLRPVKAGDGASGQPQRKPDPDSGEGAGPIADADGPSGPQDDA